MAWYVRRAFADPTVYLGFALRALPRETPLLPEGLGMPRMLWQKVLFKHRVLEGAESFGASTAQGANCKP